MVVSRETPHHEAEALLPWYATGQLDAKDRATVEQHLYSCSGCRDQLAAERRWVSEFQATSPQIESGWGRLRARIAPAPPAKAATPPAWTDLRSIIRRPAVAMLAAAQLAFVIVAGSVLVSLNKPDYHALSSAPPPATANVIVMFAPQATEVDIRRALQSAGASIVGGPTPADAYLLHVQPAQRAASLARLHANQRVQLAEPIDGGTS